MSCFDNFCEWRRTRKLFGPEVRSMGSDNLAVHILGKSDWACRGSLTTKKREMGHVLRTLAQACSCQKGIRSSSQFRMHSEAMPAE